MKSFKLLAVAVAASALIAGGSGAAMAEGATVNYSFTCPNAADFSATKQMSSSAALHVNGGGIFVVVAASTPSGVTLFATPGFEKNAVPTITCIATSPEDRAGDLVTGFFAPVTMG
jgi:hypothetical protein